MTERKPRKRLYSHVTRTRFLHLEDALDIGKIRLFTGEYRKGSGASSTAHHFLDLDDARVLFADLSWGKSVDFADFKGTSNGDGPQSRVLKIKSNGDKVWFEIQNGPGEIIGKGAVKPKGKPTSAVSIPLTVWEARKLAHAALAYIRAWEAAHLLDATPTGPISADGDSQAADGRGSPAPPVTTPSPVVTETPAGGAAPVTTPAPVVTPAAHQVGAPVTTAPALSTVEGPEVTGTPTGFWSYYNATAKPAGVAYQYARSIAEKHGSKAGDWQAAVERLKQAVTEAEAPAQ